MTECCKWSFLRSDAWFGCDDRKIHLLEEPVVINGQSHAKVIVTSTVPGIKLGPSTVVSSPTDATREDSAAVREVPTILDSGSSG